MRKAISIAALMMALTAVFGSVGASSASAWRCYRDASEAHHCYALAAWHMRGCPLECIEGGVADIETTTMNVYGWESGDFVDHEIWVGFQESGTWVESGQTAGYPYSCCGMHPFIAAMPLPGHGKYTEYEQPGEIGANQYNDYVIQDLDKSGCWRVYWGKENNNWIEIHAYCGFPAKNDSLEAGEEAGTNSEPASAGSQAVAGIWGNPESWHPWGGVYSTPHYFPEPNMCITPWQNSWPGNAVYASC